MPTTDRLRRLRWMLAGGLCMAAQGAILSAQVVRDNTLGTGRNSTLSGPMITIPPEMGVQRGGNLFHSFRTFNLAQGESATFTGQPTVTNVLARVTGGQPSNISGMLACSIPAANLYFINPAGVVFGPGGSVDVSGSFAVTTADVVKLADGGQFDAVPAGDALLTSAAPSAYGFLGASPGAIALAGDFSANLKPRLTSAPGGRVSIVGGEVVMKFAQADAPGGRVDLISVGSAGEVRGIDSLSNPTLAGFTTLGGVALTELASLSASANAGGTVFLRAANLAVDLFSSIISTSTAVDGAPVAVDLDVSDQLILNNASQISSGAFGAGEAGDVRINASRVRLESSLDFPSFVTASVFPGATGRGGDVMITAGRIDVGRNSRLSADTAGDGGGGRMRIIADQLILANTDPPGDPASISAQASGNGRPGQVEIDTRLLRIGPSSGISVRSFGTRTGGLSTINADEIVVSGFFASITTDGAGAASGSEGGGGIRISARSLTVDQDAILSTDTFFDRPGGDMIIDVDRLVIRGSGQIQSITAFAGDGGFIRINARSVDIDGPAGGINANSSSPGRGGTIQIVADEVRLAGATSVNSATLDGGGDGGAISIRAGRIQVLDDAAIGASTVNSGNAGSIEITAGSLTLSGPGVTVNSNSLSQPAGGAGGNGGVIRIQADTGEITDGALIAASTNSTGSGGSIELDVVGTLAIRGRDGSLPDGVFSRTLATTPSAGRAGNIIVRAGRVQLDSFARISAESIGTGNAGNVTVEAGDVVVNSNSSIASSGGELANGGNLRITSSGVLDLVDSSATAQAAVDGGNIDINAVERVYLVGSSITAAAGNDGGNITIDPRFVILNNSSITANAFAGDGGDITITADRLLRSTDSSITASSTLGLPGTIVISSIESDITGDLLVLPQGLASPAKLQAACGTRFSGPISSFIEVQRGGLPQEPGMPWSSMGIWLTPPGSTPASDGE